MAHIDVIISDILRREGGSTNDPNDAGGRTAYGIAEASNPEAWRDGKVTEAEARAIYERKYFRAPGFDRIDGNPALQAQLVDFGVNSGPQLAIMKLQEILKVKADGALGPKTLEAANRMDGRVLNNLLMASRVRMIGRIVQRDPSQLKFLSGWLSRALEFLV